jgi:hypothetical protein
MSIGHDRDGFAQMLTEGCWSDKIATLNGSNHCKYNTVRGLLPQDVIPERVRTDLRAGDGSHINKGTQLCEPTSAINRSEEIRRLT